MTSLPLPPPTLLNEADLDWMSNPRLGGSARLQFKVITEADDWLRIGYECLCREFGPEVLDPQERFVEWLDLNRRGEHPFPFLALAAYVVQGGEARVLGVIVGNLMRIEGERKSVRPDYFFALGNQCTDHFARRRAIKNIGSKLWRRTIAEAKAITRKLGGRLAYSFLEAENESVGFWTRLGYRWPQGVTYWQPPLEFDSRGKYVHPEVPEIAMFNPLEVGDKRTIGRRLVRGVVASVYQNWALHKYRATLSRDAMKRAEGYVMGTLLERVESRLPRTERIRLVPIPSDGRHVRSVALNQGIQHGLIPLHSPDSASLGDFDDMLRAMSQMAFGARSVGAAADVLHAMATDGRCKVVLTLSGAGTLAGLDTLIGEMIERGLVDCVIATGGAVCHSFNAGRGSPPFKLPETFQDVALFEQGYNRVFDTVETEYALDELEEILHGLLAKQSANRALCSSDVMRILGEYLVASGHRKGLISAAHARGVPIFVPAFTDGELGLDFALYNRQRRKAGRKPLQFDPFLDFERYKDFLETADVRGIFSLGGGVPRHWAQQVGPYIDVIERREKAIAVKSVRFLYGVRICPDPPYWGGLSGSTYSEGVSWGQFIAEEEGGRTAEVLSDYTLVLPLLLKGLFQRLDKARKKRPR